MRSRVAVHVWKEFRWMDAMVWLTPSEKECMEVAQYLEMHEWNVEDIRLGESISWWCANSDIETPSTQALLKMGYAVCTQTLSVEGGVRLYKAD